MITISATLPRRRTCSRSINGSFFVEISEFLSIVLVLEIIDIHSTTACRSATSPLTEDLLLQTGDRRYQTDKPGRLLCINQVSSQRGRHAATPQQWKSVRSFRSCDDRKAPARRPSEKCLRSHCTCIIMYRAGITLLLLLDVHCEMLKIRGFEAHLSG